MTAVDVFDTAMVPSVTVAVVIPAGTMTLAGAETTDGLEFESITVAPPDGAAAASVILPIPEWPPVTLVGVIVKAAIARPVFVTLTLATLEVPPPGPGLYTVMLACPAVVSADAGIDTVKLLQSTKVVGMGWPFHCTTEPGLN